MTRKVTKNGIAFVRRWEGFSATTYKDSAGLLTIGVGHLIKPSESFAEPITEQEAEDLLTKDLSKAESAVFRLIKVPLTDNQFDALCSWVFNVGSGAMQRSTLRTKLNRGEYSEASAEFLRWIWSGGKKTQGLLRRRTAEMMMFLS